MRKITKLVLIFVFLWTVDCGLWTVYADWYVVTSSGEVVVKCNYQPDQKDLETRNEIAIQCAEDIPLEQAEYQDGQITRHQKTAEELETAQQLKLESKIQQEIHQILRKEAISNLKERGEIE